ncbi:MAG: glutamate racemase [Candidatus Saccharibacteria bacterium]
MPRIGVFDSGIGGLSVVGAIRKTIPNLDIMYVNDRKNVPYGDKTPDMLLALVTPIFEKLVRDGCEVIVIACNSVTTTLIAQLRQTIPVPLIGIEPMVKPAAAATKTGIIAVCATPVTLASSRYQWLKDTYASDKTFIEPDCSQWAYMIEHNKLNETLIAKQMQDVCDAGADVIVLGCTHYHWIAEKIRDMVAGRAEVIYPEAAVLAQLQRVLATLA